MQLPTYGAARGQYYPTISLDGAVTAIKTVPSAGRSAVQQQFYGPTLNLSWLLFDLGGRSGSIGEAREALLAADWSHNAVIQNVVLGTNFTDFRLDQFAISSYSDAGADGSILAHGVVDNVAFTTPALPVTSVAGSFTNGLWQVRFLSRSNWLYTLERTTDFQSWGPASPAASGNATDLVLADTSPPPVRAFYRVRAERP